MKKIINLSLLCVFLLGNSLSASALSDIGNHRYQRAISHMANEGIINGYPDDTFQPEKTVNRAEMVKIMVGAKGVTPAVSEYHDCFPDVRREWFAPYICYAKAQGWIIGYYDATFRPDQTINFAEASKIFSEVFELPDVSYTTHTSEAWYISYVLRLIEQNAVPPTIQGFQGSLRRGETAETMYRLMENILSSDSLSYSDLEIRSGIGLEYLRLQELLQETQQLSQEHSSRNPILQTQETMLLHKLGMLESRYSRTLADNGLSVELSGGFSSDSRGFSDMRLLTGERAIDESLQLGSIGSDRSDGSDQTSADIPISDITSVSIPSHPWDEMLQGKTFSVPAIAKLAPKDMLFVHIQNAQDFLELEDTMISLSKAFGDLYTFGHMAELRPKMLRRLGIPNMDTFVSQIDEGGFVSADLSFTPRTDYALILKFKSTTAQSAFTALLGSSTLSETIQGYTVVATNASVLEEIQNATKSTSLSLSTQKDFHFALSSVEPNRDGMVYLSDAFIRKLTGPEYRINARRRNTALSTLKMLQYASFAYHRITGSWPDSLEHMRNERYISLDTVSEVAKYSVDAQGRVHHLDWGTVWEVTPVGQVEIPTVSETEKDLYERFLNEYQGYFQEFFDPVVIAFDIDEEITFHTVILPLIENSQYNWLKIFTGGMTSELSFISDPDRAGDVYFASHFAIDDLLAELGEQFLFSQPKEDSTLSEEEFIEIVEQEIAEEFDIDLQPGERLLDFIGDEILVGINAESFQSNDAENIDAWLGIKVTDQEKAHMFFGKIHETLSSSPQSSQDAVRISDISTLRLATQIYYADTATYPADFSPLEGAYIASIPTDPETNEPYLYELPSADCFRITTHLTAQNNAQRMKDDGGVDPNLYEVGTLTDTCNPLFSVTDPAQYEAEAPTPPEIPKNEYKGTEYFVLSFYEDVYYTFLDDTLYMTLSKQALLKVIDGYLSPESSFSAHVQTHIDNIGSGQSIAFLFDLIALSNTRSSSGEYIFAPSKWKSFRDIENKTTYLSEALTLAENLPNFDGTLSNSTSYYRYAPKTVFGAEFAVRDGNIFLSGNGQEVNLSSLGISFFSEEADLIYETILDLESISENMKAQLQALKGFAVGLMFTEEGVDIKISFGSPKQ